MRFPLLLALGLLSGCGDVLYAELDEPELCKTLSDREVPAAGEPGPAALEAPLPYDFSAELSRYDLRQVEVQFLRLDVVARSGVGDLGFVDALALRVADAELLDYQRGAQPPSPSLDLPGSPTNLYPYLKDGRVTLLARLQGALPDRDWSADFRVCVRVKARLAYASGR